MNKFQEMGLAELLAARPHELHELLELQADLERRIKRATELEAYHEDMFATARMEVETPDCWDGEVLYHHEMETEFSYERRKLENLTQAVKTVIQARHKEKEVG